MSLRELVINDIILWNINCFLSKNLKVRGVPMKLTNQLILCMKKNDNTYQQYSLFQFMSPTKVDLISNVFINYKVEKNRKDMTKLEKLCTDSDKNEENALYELYEILYSPQYKDLSVYYTGDCDIKDERFISIDDVTGKTDVQEFLDDLKYETNKDLKYEADFNNTFVMALTTCCFFGKNYKII